LKCNKGQRAKAYFSNLSDFTGPDALPIDHRAREPGPAAAGVQGMAVVDLFELKLPERRFVRLFLDALVHLPRELWRPVPVILDEAHLYCPERGAGEAESTEAVVSLMSQGRKRGYAGIIATLRLSKLHKDATAEANNVIIGRTWLVADQVRAGDALGLTKADRLSCGTWGRVSSMRSVRRLLSRASCISARTRSVPRIRVLASGIF
jgi:hypothetical protein